MPAAAERCQEVSLGDGPRELRSSNEPGLQSCVLVARMWSRRPDIQFALAAVRTEASKPLLIWHTTVSGYRAASWWRRSGRCGSAPGVLEAVEAGGELGQGVAAEWWVAVPVEDGGDVFEQREGELLATGRTRRR